MAVRVGHVGPGAVSRCLFPDTGLVPHPHPSAVSTVGLLPVPDGPSGHVMCRVGTDRQGDVPFRIVGHPAVNRAAVQAVPWALGMQGSVMWARGPVGLGRLGGWKGIRGLALGPGDQAGDRAPGTGPRGPPHRLLQRPSFFRCLTVDAGMGPPF